MLDTFYEVGEVYFRLLGTNGFHLKAENEKFTAVGSLRRHNLKRELTQPRRRRQQERHKFAYLTMKNNSFARFARAVFIFDISQTFLVLSAT